MSAFKPVTGVTLDVTQAIVGQNTTLTATVSPSDATNKTVKWSFATTPPSGTTLTAGTQTGNTAKATLNAGGTGDIKIRVTIENGIKSS
jgi:alpha-L-fucosidase 2